MSGDTDGTVPVRFEVLAIERVNRGRLIGISAVEVDIAGISLTLQGIQIMRRADNTLECSSPVFRHARTGEWLPAVVLPPELSRAIAAEVLTVFEREHITSAGKAGRVT